MSHPLAYRLTHLLMWQGPDLHEYCHLALIEIHPFCAARVNTWFLIKTNYNFKKSWAEYIGSGQILVNFGLWPSFRKHEVKLYFSETFFKSLSEQDRHFWMIMFPLENLALFYETSHKWRCMKSVVLNAVGDEWGQQKIFGPYLITSQVNQRTRMNVK